MLEVRRAAGARSGRSLRISGGLLLEDLVLLCPSCHRLPSARAGIMAFALRLEL